MADVLLISASPRKGNTDHILQKIQDKSGGEIIYLREKKIGHCKGCFACRTRPICTVKDDMQEVMKKVLAADTLILGSPNYYNNVTSLAKAFIDRTHVEYDSGGLAGKKLIAIMVGGGSTNDSGTYLAHAIHGFVKYMKLDLVGSFAFQALDTGELKADTVSVDSMIKCLNL